MWKSLPNKQGTNVPLFGVLSGVSCEKKSSNSSWEVNVYWGGNNVWWNYHGETKSIEHKKTQLFKIYMTFKIYILLQSSTGYISTLFIWRSWLQKKMHVGETWSSLFPPNCPKETRTVYEYHLYDYVTMTIVASMSFTLGVKSIFTLSMCSSIRRLSEGFTVYVQNKTVSIQM